MRRAVTVVVVSLLSLAPCSVAAAQLGPQAPAPLTQGDEPPPAANRDADDDGGLSTLQMVLIFGSAMAVLAGIAWLILRDAHRAAPVEQRQTPATQPKLSARERERQQRQRRNRTKAARQQRKRNRSR